VTQIGVLLNAARPAHHGSRIQIQCDADLFEPSFDSLEVNVTASCRDHDLSRRPCFLPYVIPEMMS
jgi:hypothetical protein